MMLCAAITTIDEEFFRLHPRQFCHLRVRSFQRVAIVGIAVQRLDAHYPTTLGSRRYRHLATELVLLVLFSFGDALHFRRLHAVKLVLVLSLLPIDARRPLQGLGQLRAQLLAVRGGFALDVAKDSAQVSAQSLGLFARPLQLLGARISSLLLQRAFAHAHVTLPQIDPGALRFPHHPPPPFLIQPTALRTVP